MAFVFPFEFNPQPTLRGKYLSLSPLCERDRRELFQAASDPLIWSGHPAKTRHEEEHFNRYFDFLVSTRSALTIRSEEDGVIGCSAYYTDTISPSRLSIGFTFLVREHWGGVTNFRLKELMLQHLYSCTSESWFHIVPDNKRSQIATARLGAVLTHECNMDLGTGEQAWLIYCLTAERWAANLNR